MEAITSTVFVSIACFSTLLRCYTRVAIIGGLKMDDVLSVLASFASIGATVMVWIEDTHGLGKDINTVSPQDLTTFLKAFWVYVICFCIGIVMVKCSAILSCMRFILIGKMRIFCWVLLVSFIGMAVSATCLQLFSCTPVSGAWDLTVPNRRCMDVRVLWYIGSGIITITDIIVVAIPIYTVKNLKVPRRQKIALIVVFALGGLACIASVIRCYASVILGNSSNFTQSNKSSALWAPIELNIGIICVNIPPLKPLVVAIAPFLLGDKSKSTIDISSNLSGETLAESRPHQRKSSLDIELAYPMAAKVARP